MRENNELEIVVNDRSIVLCELDVKLNKVSSTSIRQVEREQRVLRCLCQPIAQSLIEGSAHSSVATK